MDLKDKNIVLTGASSGIGFELLKLLLAEGAKVVAASRNMTRSEFVSSNLLKIDIDVSKEEEIDKLFDYALKEFAQIDIFIANAGFAYFEEYDGDFSHIDKIFRTNVYAVFYAAKKMKELFPNHEFNFVITASAVSFLSLPGYALYSGTKAALRGFADAYRFELNKGQNLQLVYPVATKTEFFNVARSKFMPWPRQDPLIVASETIRGIKKNKNNIYPAKLVFIGRYFMPFALKIYQKFEGLRFKKSLKRVEK